MPVFSGTTAADRILGSAAADQIYGLAGNDTLYGAGGNDWLIGGLGADILVGGLGDDSYDIDVAGDQVVERAGEGIDRVRASVSHQLAANVEILMLVGTANINGFGNALANTILGNAGNNVLNGGAGKDAMAGGAGNDVYDVDSAGDMVSEGANAGYDRVRASVSYTLGAHVEELNLAGAAAISGTGNALANTIIGNAGANVLDGGAGDDLLIGGKGNDTYYVDAAGDRAVERVGEGTDRVLAWVSHQLAANVENLALQGSSDINGVGNTLDNVIVGNAGNNALNGGVGDDRLVGGKGNDVYDIDSIGDRIQELASEGYDRVRATISYTLGANLEELNLTGTKAINGTGNTLANTIVGNAGANQLSGGGGDDQVFGGEGADGLTGGVGKDYVYGGAGNDWVQEDAGHLRVGEIYDGGDGYDTFSIGWGSADLSHILFRGFEAILSGSIQMLSQQALLFSKIEAHDIRFVDGGVVDFSNHKLIVSQIFLSDFGNYLKLDQSGLGHFLGVPVWGGLGRDIVVGRDAGSEIYGGGGDDVLTGGAGFDQILGDSGNDVIVGGGDSDTIKGGEGSDQLTGGRGGDAFYFIESQDEDVVVDFSPSEDNLCFEGLLHGEFSYLGSGAFTGGGSTEARFANGRVFLDSDGDGMADITIRLNGITSASQIEADNFGFW